MFKLTVFLFALIFGAIYAQKENLDDIRSFKHPLTDMPGPASDVSTAYFFPNQLDLKFPIGEVVNIVCHLSNDGPSFYNISAIMGSLNAPFDFNHHFQNYSYKPVGMVVKSGEEISLKYTFQLHPDLEPVDYQLAITVFYESDSQSFSTTFFNQTVELYSPLSEYDFETVTSAVYGIASLVFVVLVGIFACFPESKVSRNLTKTFKKLLPAEGPSYTADKESDEEPKEKPKKKSKRVHSE